MTASAPSTQPGGGEGAGGGQRGHRRKFPEVVGLFRRPARDPAGSPRRPCAGGEVGVGVLRGEAPRDPERPLLRLLARLSPSLRATGDRTWTEEEEERSGSPALPLPGGYRSGSEPRGTEPHQDYKQYGIEPLRKQGWPPCGNCSSGRWWPCTGSARLEPKVWGVTPTWGGGEGAGGGSPLGSRRPPGPRSWPGQSPLPGVSGSVPRVWGLFFGDGAVLLRLVASE